MTWSGTPGTGNLSIPDGGRLHVGSGANDFGQTVDPTVQFYQGPVTTDTPVITMKANWANSAAPSFTGFIFDVITDTWPTATSKPFQLKWQGEPMYDLDYDAVLVAYYRGSGVTRGPTFNTRRSLGTNLVPSAVQSGTELGGILLSGTTPGAAGYFDGAQLKGIADTAPTSGAIGGAWIFQVSPPAGGVFLEAARMTSQGRMGIRESAPAGTLHVSTASYGSIGMIVRAMSGQTANLTNWQDSTGAALVTVTSAGQFDFSTSTQTTIGGAGGAAALPATPRGYLEILIGGTKREIPFYDKV